ncbi:MAG: type II toxin-antitoxin system VapC family toxin [Synoicihabitans sp.]
MRVLVDTHALLWFLQGDSRLSSTARETIELPTNHKILSDASIWEMSIKQSLGKLKLADPFESRLVAALDRNAIEQLPIARPHLFAVSRLPFHHRDPFDRLTIATAMVENLPIVTQDPHFASYPIEVIW